MTTTNETTSGSNADVARARKVLEAGGLVALPTETVYGLAALITRGDALRRIFAVKGRPVDHPLIVHVADLEHARVLSRNWTPAAERLATRFWPGPLTLIVERSAGVDPVVSGGLGTVAIRCPAHELCLQLLRSLSAPVAAPSANRFGRVSPTCAQHVVDDLGSDVDFVLDGGACEVGLESTIVDCTVDPVQILRPGAITEEEIRSVLDATAPASGRSRASGMLESHYAPRCRVVAVADRDEARRLSMQPNSRLIDAAEDPLSAGRTLYADLRQCDADGVAVAVVLLPPATGIGLALRDRVLKAAAGR